jgi:NADP-dependent 3-hydroxy acid dehydrogenase YdfG
MGASSGIGAAVTSALRGRGERVYALSRRGTVPVDDALVTGLACDIADYGELADALRSIPESLSTVVNCVGTGFYAPLTDDHSGAWQEMARTNVVGLANMLAVVDGMDLDDFVHVGSLAAHRVSGVAGNGFYSATKTAAKVLLESHRQTLRARGRQTRILTVSPGFVAGTDFGRNFFRDRPDLARDLYADFPPLAAQDVAEQVLAVLDTPRHIELTDVVMRPQGQPD